MKISDVLWQAACRISDGGKYCCDAIRFTRDGLWLKGSVRADARAFFIGNFGPNDWNEGIWFGVLSDEQSQNQRFFHLLSAYEMAKGMGL